MVSKSGPMEQTFTIQTVQANTSLINQLLLGLQNHGLVLQVLQVTVFGPTETTFIIHLVQLNMF